MVMMLGWFRAEAALASYKAVSSLGVRQLVREEYLDCHQAIKTWVASLVNLAHPSGAKRRENFVGAQLGAGCEQHSGF